MINTEGTLKTGVDADELREAECRKVGVADRVTQLATHSQHLITSVH